MNKKHLNQLAVLTALCVAVTATVTASAGTAPYTYLWSNGGTPAGISGLSADTYNVTVTDANNCTATCGVTVNEPSCNLSLSVDAEDLLCNGDDSGSINLTITGAQGAVSILWNDGATAEDRTGLSVGTYSVTVTDSGNCTATLSTTVTQPDALTVVCSKTDVSITNGTDGTASVVAEGGISPYTYLWSNGGTTAGISGLSADTYNVTVTMASPKSACGSTR